MEINWKTKTSAMREMQAQPLDEKIELAEPFISHLLFEHKHPVIAWSGGKDSTVLLFLALRQKPDVDVAWVNTGVEFPQCIRFIRHLKEQWQLNLHIARPETTFWKVVEEYGWPMLGKGSSGYWWSRAQYLERKGKTAMAEATRAAQISAACCRFLKERPMERLCSILGVDCVVVGNMVSESRQRFLTWAQKGSCYFNQKAKRCTAWPLAAWTPEDIAEFHQRFGLPRSPIYDMGHSRNGCWPCLMDFRFPDNKLRALRHSHYKLWRFLIIEKGLGKRIIALKIVLSNNSEEINLPENLDNYVQLLVGQSPNFFDSIESDFPKLQE